MTPARIREIKKRAQGDGPAAVQARRQIANMRLPNESGADFVKRQLLDEEALDAIALERSSRSEENEMSEQIRSVMEANGRTALARRAANIDALRLKDPTRS